jgi:glycosyltransferase involved in cell wall biosynthesis
VLTVHWLPRRPRQLRRLSRCLAGVIATTQAAREALVNQSGVERAKIKVIRNGIDVARLEGRDVPAIFSSPTPVVGSLGPIEERRGHELFVRAASLLKGRDAEAQFVVAGEGAGLRALRKLVANLGLERRLTVATDFVAYEEVLEALDVVVQSSQVDVSGFSILEAMGHGRPVVAFNTGTACEIVEDRKTGLLVPKGDVEALAAAIEELVGDPEAARLMGQNARRAVRERFDVRTIARETLRYYAGIISQ